jgi:hypothetical protein
MKKLRGGGEPTCKSPLTEEDLIFLMFKYNTSTHDDDLFLTMLLTGFYSLLRLGELAQPTAKTKCSSKKLTLRHTLHVFADRYEFHLPYHKGDRFYDGNTIIVKALPDSHLDPLLQLIVTH